MKKVLGTSSTKDTTDMAKHPTIIMHNYYKPPSNEEQKAKSNKNEILRGYEVSPEGIQFPIKLHDIENIATTINSVFATPNYFVLGLTDLITQGTGYNERIGNKIHIRNIWFNLRVVNHILDYTVPAAPVNKKASTDVEWGRVDAYIIYDRAPNGSTPNYQDIFAAAPSNNGLQRRWNNNQTRFTFMHHKSFEWSGTNDQHVTSWMGMIECNVPVQYTSSTAMPADVQSGQIWLLFRNSGYVSGVYEATTDVAYELRLGYLDF